MFKVIIKDKDLLNTFDIEDVTVSEAIYTLYSNNDKFKININWNNFLIPISGESFSQIFNDLILMLELIQSYEEEFSINFLDSSFTAKWNFTKKNGILKINADWYDVASYGDSDISIENLNDVCNFIEEDIEYFVNEWNSLLKEIKTDLKNSGYSDELEGFDYLMTLK